MACGDNTSMNLSSRCFCDLVKRVRKGLEKQARCWWMTPVSSRRRLHRLLHLRVAGQGKAQCQARRQEAGTHTVAARTGPMWSRTAVTPSGPSNDGVTQPAQLLSLFCHQPTHTRAHSAFSGSAF